MRLRADTWSGTAQLQYACKWQSEQFSADVGALRLDITTELISIRHEIRIVLLALVGFMLSVVLALTETGIV